MRDPFDYNEDLHIDSQALDVEWLDQPTIFMKYARILADAEREVDRAKENLDVVRANLDRKIRLRPERYGLEKIVEKAVEGAIAQTKRFKEANELLINAKYEAKIAKGAVDAFHQRKDALENLVRLYAASYFAGPKIPRELTKEWEAKQVQRRSNASVAAKLKGKKLKKTDDDK